MSMDLGYLSLSDQPLLSSYEQYRQAFGSLFYVSGYTRPDIAAAAFAFNKKSKLPESSRLERSKKNLSIFKWN